MPAAPHLPAPIPHYTSTQAATGTIIMLALVATAVVLVLLALRRRP